MEIRWLGHAAFLLTSANGTRVITDPYQSGAYGGALGYKPIAERADVVTVSHDHHEDHNYTNDIQGDFVVVKSPGQHEVCDLKVAGTACFHDTSGGSERGDNTIMTIEIDGLRICHLGDLGHILSDQEVESVGSVDVLLVPVGGTYTIGPAEADQLVEALRPKVVIPMHFKTSKCSFPLASVDEYTEGKPLVRRPGSTSIELVRSGLPDQTELVVLEPAL